MQWTLEDHYNMRVEVIEEAYEDLIKYMDKNQDEDGNSDFPDALSEVRSEYNLTEEEEQAVKDLYDNMCNNL